MLPLAVSSTRVESQTPPHVNSQIADRMRERLAFYAEHPQLINRRLAELDREWDIERVLEANASTLITASSLMAFVTGRRRWAFLSLAVGGFLFQHAVQGWCPPMFVLRRMGIRTVREIDRERYALKALRGDFAKKPLDKKSTGDKPLDPTLKAASAIAATK